MRLLAELDRATAAALDAEGTGAPEGTGPADVTGDSDGTGAAREERRADDGGDR